MRRTGASLDGPGLGGSFLASASFILFGGFCVLLGSLLGWARALPGPGTGTDDPFEVVPFAVGLGVCAAVPLPLAAGFAFAVPAVEELWAPPPRRGEDGGVLSGDDARLGGFEDELLEARDGGEDESPESEPSEPSPSPSSVEYSESSLTSTEPSRARRSASSLVSIGMVKDDRTASDLSTSWKGSVGGTDAFPF